MERKTPPGRCRALELMPLLAAALLAAALGCGGPAAEPRAAGKLEVREARASLMPGMGVAYLTVVNPGPAADRLLRIETPAARRAETHESVEQGGIVRMVPRPEGFQVPAGGTLELRPGGKHVMLVEPRPPAAGADTIPLTLRFERAGTIEVRAALVAMGMDRGDGGGGGR